MDYIQVTFEVQDEQLREALIAQLSEMGAEGFEEQETALVAYAPHGAIEEHVLQIIAHAHNLRYTIEHIPPQNWNAKWEENFQPVLVEGFCAVRADFHPPAKGVPYEIIITPKMSFGTGHHATTRLMMMQMKDMELQGKTVLDFGTGTGILAILAEMLGAQEILAIDNDEWSYENAQENIARNDARKISIQQSSLEGVTGKKFDIILANINRHILLQYMQNLHGHLLHNGKILMSGLLSEDREIIVEAAAKAGFVLENGAELNNWIALLFSKK